MNRTYEQMRAEIRRLAPRITARAAEIEAARRTPPDIVDSLRSIGIFRMFVPRSRGGLELDLPLGLDVVRDLARIDGSVGWNTMIGSVSGLAFPLMTPETYERIYRNGPDVICAGAVHPGGTAEPVAGGWRVTGRWAFASGCQHADWMLGLCIMTKGGKPLPGPAGEGGPPSVRGILLPAKDWQIEDSWYAEGLKGTGSTHIRLKDKVVAAENFFDFPAGSSCVAGPLYQSVPHFLPLMHGAFSTGMAEGALAELIALANTGRQQSKAATSMRDSEIFQYELGRIAADVRAARAFHESQAATHWRHAQAGTLRDDETLLAEGSQSAIWLATTGARAIDSCFTLGGGSTVYDSSPLQRRLRDMHAATQHAIAHQRHYAAVGKQILTAGAVPSEEQVFSIAN
jgi:indole-3-acetate monooxygenase